MMPKFLVQATVTKEGIREVLTKAKGTGVREAVTRQWRLLHDLWNTNK
jgi:hypothetical protein